MEHGQKKCCESCRLELRQFRIGPAEDVHTSTHITAQPAWVEDQELLEKLSPMHFHALHRLRSLTLRLTRHLQEPLRKCSAIPAGSLRLAAPCRAVYPSI